MKTLDIYCEIALLIGAIILIGYHAFKRDLTRNEKLAINVMILFLIVGSLINFAQIMEWFKCLSPQK